MEPDENHYQTKINCYKEIVRRLAAQEEARRQQPPICRFFPEKVNSFEYIMKVLVSNPHLLAEDADIRVYRAFVQENGHCFADPKYHDKPKCGTRALELRRSGNALYTRRQFEPALNKYNESICAAPVDSEHVALGYANRSAVYCGQGLYDVALVNIAMAKQHNYPERLMAKLLARESYCRGKLEDIKVPLVEAKLETNPKIPCLAQGIHAHQHPTQGPVMVAKRNFKAGDVILREKPMIACLERDNLFVRCNYCIATNLSHLIPCPNCAAAMFCDEECLRKGQYLHRFECGVCAEVSMMSDFWLGPRLFFHGLSLLGDNVTKMMKLCKKPRGNDSFFSLDYAKYDPLEEFRTFLTAKSRRTERPLYDNIIQFNAAVFFEMYMKVPLVRSLITTAAQKDFMQQCFVDYQIQKRNLAFRQAGNGHLYPIASCFGHSCDPNTVLLEQFGNELKMIVLRPIRTGEQIHFSFGPTFDQSPQEHTYHVQSLGFDCLCDFCHPDRRREWLAKAKQPSSIDTGHRAVVKKVVTDGGMSCADKMNALQQFIQRYGSSHPQEDYARMVHVYRNALIDVHSDLIRTAMRRKICG